MAPKILIIDDDPQIVQYLETLLADHGFETLTAGHGVEAFDILKDEKPDLITLDLDMPEEYGTRFYRRMTKNEAFKDIPVIVISGITRPDKAIRKAVAVFEKPFDPQALVKAVKNALGQ